MKDKIDWIIHLCANGIACDDCGELESGFIEYTCNAHTHGMEKYNHKDFQVVLNMPPKDICYILNTLGLRVQSGERFHAGDLVTGVFLDCPVRLDAYEETGRNVLRVIIPDKDNIFPEDDRCTEPYRLQLISTDMLCPESGVRS